MKRVLVAEDNRLERKILLHILRERFGKTIRIDEVSNGELALQYLENQPYDLVITDLIMPKIEGIQLIRTINTKFTSTKIIAISGSKPYYLYLAKKLGIEGVFTKPLNNDLLFEMIERLFNFKTTKTI